MDNPDGEFTIINVKNVRQRSWNALVMAASHPKVAYGRWISDAIDFRLEMEAKGIQGPGEASQAVLTPDQMTARIAALAELAKGLAALKAAGSRAVGISALSSGLTTLLTDERSANRPIRIRQISQESVKPAITLHASDSEA
jgi:hypothetical protein